MSRIDEDFKENLLFSPGREQETGIPNLSIEEEMEELVPELRGGRVYGKRGKRATNVRNSLGLGLGLGLGMYHMICG